MAKKSDVAPKGEVEHRDANEITRANVLREVNASPDFVSLYANDVQIQTTPWDVRLIVGQISNIPTAENPAVKVTQTGELRLSPQLAKKMTMILIGQLQNYEARFGPIPQPED